ncbi:MAG TPA: hypothetical protein VFE90_24085 [Myxococcales bacterium]|jgi:hypothetical protein|nr:hypothetical protein [Myxococcales bacterium]
MRVESTSEIPAVSYKQLRALIGLLGILLPVIVWALGPAPLKQSISAYYYSNVRDFFVGLLSLTGVFLICYVGYKNDPPVTVVAGIAALLVACFPTSPGPVEVAAMADQPPLSVVGLLNMPIKWSARIHYGSATTLFLLLAYMCGRLFVKTDPPSGPMTDQKLRRNVVYKMCARVMVVAMACEGANALYWQSRGVEDPTRILLAVETVCLMAFGIAWLVKGEVVPGLRDAPDGPAKSVAATISRSA